MPSELPRGDVYALAGDLETDERLRAFVDALPFAILQLDPGGRATFTNRAWRAYTGIAYDRELTAIESEDRARLPWIRAAALAGRDRVDVRIRNADHVPRWFALDATPVVDDGRLVRWIVTGTEIDERVRSVEAVRAAAARAGFLARADAAMSRYVDPPAILQAVADASVESFADYCIFDVKRRGEPTLLRAAVAFRDRALAATFAGTRAAPPPLENAAHPITEAWRNRTTVFHPTVEPRWYPVAATNGDHLERIRAIGLRSLISTVVVARGAAYGVLTFCRRHGSPSFTDEDRHVAEDVAHRVAIALENAHLYEEARRTAETQRAIAARESFYSRLSEALGRSLDLREMLETLADLLVPELADGAVIDLCDPGGRWSPAAVAHVDPATLHALQDAAEGRYVTGAREAAPLGAGSAEARAYVRGGADAVAAGSGFFWALGVRSFITVPIVSAGGVQAILTVLTGPGGHAALGDGDLRTYVEIARRISPAIGNAVAYARERRVAQSFHEAALSLQLPAIRGFRFDAMYEAGKSEALVGGDWYDAFLIDDGRCVISIGDVVGSGLEAAIAMINVRQTIRGVAQIHPDPALMLQAADRTVRMQYPDRFVTAFTAVLDPITKQGAYANAGHPPALLRAPSGTVVALDERTLPLGLINDSAIGVAHFSFDPGCSLLLYTDGLVESGRDIVAGLRQLRATFAAEEPGEGAVARIYQRALARASSDDVAMLLVSSEVAGDLRRWRFDPFWRDAVDRVRRELLEAVAAAGFPPERVLHVEIVFAEVLSNLLRYVPGPVDLFLERNRHTHVVHVLDQGPGFQFNPRLPSDLMSEGGRGLFLIAALSNQFSVERRPGGGSHARIVFARETERLESHDGT